MVLPSSVSARASRFYLKSKGCKARSNPSYYLFQRTSSDVLLS
ncbi:unnamed protein product [Acanthoscelides obtectus]|uniref:Uncharacterized protein n=1 Tax=Acanthoscelides obtectus TaxID=200917 RepID=A0A9P0P1E5_ACAOB|nr:unnamed protein product [Acanthoscelides obtectus]CAK1668881.1 hypothetical protein AOBTE_LOCUS26658 [Acanthoscelides obtectus]